MKGFLKIFLTLGIMLCLSNLYAANNSNHPTTFLGPTLNLGYTSALNDVTAFSVLGEGGVQNWRIGATLAWKILENQRFKVSGEYLWQKITYPFFSGNTSQWVQQGALGALYEYNLCGCLFNPSFDVEAYLSHAPSKNLHTVNGFITFPDGVFTTFADHRRIAGSNAAGVAPGVNIEPWCGGRIGLDLNYDNVRYDKKYGRNEDAKGFGGTFRLSQILTENIGLSASAAIRQPFNNYKASLDWFNVPYYGRWTLDLDAAYTAGKNTLPNTWNVGLSANYFMDQRCETYSHKDFKGEILVPVADDFVDWTAEPAVYLPQVLAIPDEQVVIPDPINPICAPVPVSSGLLIVFPGVPFGGTETANVSSAFIPGSGLHYAITSISPLLFAGNSVVIDSTTGIITAHQGATGPQFVTVTVTASNRCGSATTTVDIDLGVPSVKT